MLGRVSRSLHETARPATPNWPLRLLLAAALLALFHLPPRAQLVGFVNSATLTRPVKNVPKMLISATYDVAYVAGLAAVFLAALLPVRRRARAGRVVYITFLAAGLLSLLAAMANTQVVATLGRTFNYRWLYYSDFLQSVDARQAMLAALSWKIVLAMVCLCAAFILLSVAAGKRVERAVAQIPPARARAIAIALTAIVSAYLLAGRWYLVSRQWPHEKLVNPVYAFARSVLEAAHAPALFTMRTEVDDSDFAPRASTPSTRLIAIAKGKPPLDVILFVLESTPAEYLRAYGSTYKVTPHLDRWAQRGAVFENAYAHAPATNKSLCSILCSLYPWISFKTVSQEKPDIALPSIVTQLAPRGYASAFFFSGDLSYQSAGEFVRARGFDYVEDYRQRKSTRQVFTHDRWPFLNGSDDRSTVDSLLAWLDRQRGAGRPGFAMLWTMMTHYPYFTAGDVKPFAPSNENLFNTYLNALHYGDAAFGAMMDHLEEQHRLDDTLVIVVGDHGEAFGRHEQLSHGNKIYEENCHVPLLLIHPTLAGQRHKTVGGLVDIAPTITDMLGLPSAETWQGRSLFAADRPDRTYFFAPWSDHLFGYREHDTKFIYNATTDRYELYDLAADPTEQTNLIPRRAGEISQRTRRLAAWVQYQNRMFDRLMK